VVVSIPNSDHGTRTGRQRSALHRLRENDAPETLKIREAALERLRPGGIALLRDPGRVAA
jgi:hypothetical protein